MVFILVCITPFSSCALRKAPSIRLFDLTGHEIPFPISEKMVILLFMSPECFSCSRELYSIQTYQKSLPFVLIPVCVGCDWREVKNITDSLNLNLSVYMGTNALKASWGVWEFPTAFLVDQEMKVLEKWEGKVVLKELKKQLTSVKTTEREKKKEDEGSTSSSCSNGMCY
ncbi:MAG: hypothetical protein NTX88_00725 [Candidatus Atribacteria bacterium]|nr:hypothetical protein [Candidatus Atribacteria bacterium]